MQIFHKASLEWLLEVGETEPSRDKINEMERENKNSKNW